MYTRVNFKQIKQIKQRLGIDEGGRVQDIVDASVKSHLRNRMPASSEQHMISQTNQVMPGLIVVATPYAHYQNEGELYLAKNGSSWAKKDERKFPTGRQMDYSRYSGTNRGPHFVERTINEDFNDILNEAKKGVRK